ncbi:MAG: DUF3035 domain-containing protein [Alphaproteobacteria bacterium]|nr:DUF3035 domain-containing protein [Alphaproteobacteria bacterium]MBT7941809.1 DUF3035 domain-containing protein [Alphaproteobacteria bacterium]
MQKLPVFLCLAGAVALLSGCESARKAFSEDKTSPDEFAVFSRPPLSLPPEYTLRPPKPGKGSLRGDETSAIAKRAVLSQAVRRSVPPKRPQGSPGVIALLRDTGGLDASPNIRATINDETSILSNQDQRFVDKLIFWVDEKEAGGTVVDAKKEQKRIQKTQALGKAITEGETPEVKIKRAKKGLLEF